jgi:hypothetical protein
VLVCECHRDRVRRNDVVLDQDVAERLSFRACNRQALLELFLAEQPGARQQFA